MKENKFRKAWIPAAAAILVIGVTIGLNTSEAFAKSAENIPILGTIAKVLTIRDYESEDNVNISIEQPEIVVDGKNAQTDSKEETGTSSADTKEPEAASSTEYVASVNAAIEKIVSDYKADATKRIEEYKQAFLETGGTEEEWLERGVDIDVSYEIKYQSDTTLSLVLTTNESWVAVYGQQYFFNMDLVNGKDITLEELLGEDYVEKANAVILEQIKQRSETEGYVYWGYEQYSKEYFEANPDFSMGDEGFKTVGPETKFYINEAGNPVIVFDKYEIGPGYMGSQEFEIEK
ncbi:MAG: anti-sigma-V factor rsiV [Lachnospiraceae bacterium]|nr:anti-sigma-V factor rsiV [Lachnospiraceae bacterium]